MTTVSVKLVDVGKDWTDPCQHAITHLNALFKRSGVNVVLSLNGAKGPTITVKVDPSIQGTAVHGRTIGEFSDMGKLLRAEVRLPVKISINTPQGLRDAGPGVFEVIAAHELVHALGHSAHNSHLMGQTMQKAMGQSAAGDKLMAGSVRMPPLMLSPGTISELKQIWA